MDIFNRILTQISISKGPVHDLLERDSYISSYNRRDRIPDWVGEHLTAESITKGDGVDRGKSNFQEDPSIPLLYRGLLNDYRSSGYDRGHMAPAGDAVSTQEAMDQTFYLSNMCPQVGVGFNRNYWAYFEAFCRSLTASYTDVYVYTGPLFLPQSSSSKTAGKSDYTVTYKMLGDVPNIAVPTHFYKVILIPNANGYAAAAFVLPNASINSKTALTSFQVKLEVIEKASGLQFFSKLDRSTFTDLCTLTTCTV
ncbi:hypothetical protein BDF14DRAFT_1735585 [Spinellus fusiger]|nr:hypothetical protein BDF14DRAFT_1735585 [Spinellus fusiger]